MKKSLVYVLLGLFLLSIPAFAIVPISYTPVSGTDTTGAYTPGSPYVLTAGDLNAVANYETPPETALYYNSQNYWGTSYVADDYIEFVFGTEIPCYFDITNVTLYFYWNKYCTINATRILVWDETAGVWRTYDNIVPYVHISTDDAQYPVDRLEVKDILPYINTPEDLNNLKIRFQATKRDVGGETFHNLVRVDIEYEIPPCISLPENTCEDECNAPRCDWCPLCSSHQVNTWLAGTCVNEGAGCGYHCEPPYCGAECAEPCDCKPYCESQVLYENSTCTKDCMCDYESYDCNSLDDWYDTGTTRTIDYDQCNLIEQKEQEYRDYYCYASDGTGCDYGVTDTKWVDTSAPYPKKDGTPCNDGLFCTEPDTCQSGVCDGPAKDCSDNYACTIDSCDEVKDECVNSPDDSYCLDDLWCNGQEYCDPDDGSSDVDGCVDGTQVDCSFYNIFEIGTCDYDPDDYIYTWDWRNQFNSECDEDKDVCTEGDYTINHHCADNDLKDSFDRGACDAECDENDDCPGDWSCFDYIYMTRDAECNLSSCMCQFCDWMPGTCTQSVDICCAECDDDYDCDDEGLEGVICYYDGTCDTDPMACSCSYSEEYCPPEGTVENGTCYWGKRDCYDEVGCTLFEDPMTCNDVCDPETGPEDTIGPVVSDLSIYAECNILDITAIATDTCTEIEQAEYYFDSCDIGNGYTMYASDGVFDETQEDIYRDDIDVSGLSEGDHMLYSAAQDFAYNWGGCDSASFCVDKTDPETTKQYGTPFYEKTIFCILNDDGYCEYDHYITRNTTITLTATDADTCADSDVASTWYSLATGGLFITDAVAVFEYTGPFTISGEGEYDICFHSIDEYCNQEEETCQTFIVDNTPPQTTKEIGQHCENDYPIVNNETTFTLTAVDYPETLNAGVYKTYYRYCEGEDPCTGSWNEYTVPFTVTGVADGLFRLEYYSVDNLGNEEDVQYEIDEMMNTPPETIITTLALPGTAKLGDFDVNITDSESCTLCYYRVTDGVGDSEEWIPRECNSIVHVNVSELDFCPCGIGYVYVEAKGESCLNVEGNIAAKNYTIDVCNPPKFISAGPDNTVHTSDVEVYAETHIPSDCRLDSENKAYEEMAYQMDTDDGYNHTYTLSLPNGLYVYTIKCWAVDNGTYDPFRWDSEKIVFTVDVYTAPASTSGGGGTYSSYSIPYIPTKTTTTVESTPPADSGTTTTIEEADNVVYEEPVYTTTTQESRATIREEVGPGIITGMASAVASNPLAVLGILGSGMAALLLVFKRSWIFGASRKSRRRK